MKATLTNEWVTPPFTPSTVGARAHRAPVLLRQLELANGCEDVDIPRSRSGRSYESMRLLVRLHRRPLGTVSMPVWGRTRVTWGEIAEAVATQLQRTVDAHLADDGFARHHLLDGPLPHTQLAPCRYENDTAYTRVRVTVVVTTCHGGIALVECVRSILRSCHPHVEIVVVENRPDGSEVTDALAHAFPSDARVRVVTERRRGLSSARNRGLDEARGDVVAFTDDDVVVDRYWLAHLAQAFVVTGADCVTGLILPFEMETPAQRWLEEYGGFGKGFRREVFGADRDDDPLYPYAAGRFGSGANTALRASVARRLGGFDTHLGAGTPSAGGEDLDLYIRLLRAGHTLTYEPAAIVWHRHHADVAQLRRQLLRYGTGLSAALTKQLVSQPYRGDILRRVPRGASYLLRRDSAKNDRKSPSYPASLTALEWAGFAFGPASYLWTRARAARERA
jgi:GT2 family glycosyltransferase